MVRTVQTEQPQETTQAIAAPRRVLFPSPIGNLGIELTGTTVSSLTIVPKGRERKSFTPFVDLLGEDNDLDEIFGRFSEYFAGARRDLELGYDLGPSGITGFEKRVFQEVAKIPFGKTRTYQRIATSAGHPDGYRQVLAVLVTNPVPIIIPCHRVVTNKSGIGSYIGGKEKKRWLLAMEKESAGQAD